MPRVPRTRKRASRQPGAGKNEAVKREDIPPDSAIHQDVAKPEKRTRKSQPSRLSVHAVRVCDLDLTAPEPPPELADRYDTERWVSLCRRLEADRERRRDGEIEKDYFRMHLEWARQQLAHDKAQNRDADQ
jgi:hypothetical protein